MEEKKAPKFVDGLRAFKPNEKAPKFVKLNVVVNESFVNWFAAEKNEKNEVNINLLLSQKGVLYFVKNEWQPKKDYKTNDDIV